MYALHHGKESTLAQPTTRGPTLNRFAPAQFVRRLSWSVSAGLCAAFSGVFAEPWVLSYSLRMRNVRWRRCTRLRRAFLATCRRHSDVVVVEGLPLGWCAEESESRLGPVTAWLSVERTEGAVVHGAVAYSTGSDRWRHSFAMHVFADRDELGAASPKRACAAAGSRFPNPS
jgi:hypothetical protein